MKYFKYWTQETFKITIDARIEEIKLLAGSNISRQAAAEEASIAAKKIEQRIASGVAKGEYDAVIKEYVSDVIDSSNIITICRYGAKILNTTDYTILDLDDYPVSFFDFFKSLGKLTKKERIVFKFEENIKRYPLLGRDFRIYETAKGIRVIGKKYIDPTTKPYESLMRKLNVDWLYIQLSRKQKCYRARLTPKPYRMRIKTIKIKSPLDCEKQAYTIWSQEYDKHAKNFTTIRLLKSIGQDFSYDRVIKMHDELCRSDKNNKLA